MLKITMILFTLPLFIGCATLTKGTTQELEFTSEPSGATVLIQGKKGITPCKIRVRKRRQLTAQYSLKGYFPISQVINPRIERNLWFNYIPIGMGGVCLASMSFIAVSGTISTILAVGVFAIILEVIGGAGVMTDWLSRSKVAYPKKTHAIMTKVEFTKAKK